MRMLKQIRGNTSKEKIQFQEIFLKIRNWA